MNADQRFEAAAQRLGYTFDGALKIGGNYTPLLEDGKTLYISGQIPRVGDQVVVTGRVGAAVSLAHAQLSAQICTMRALALLQRHLGSLDLVARVLRLTVYVQCTESFTQHSEVADGASNLLVEVLGDAGRHTRTSVGVYQLPKNASTELDLIAAGA
ncbi:RidA family protein [Lampropedia puyangensis]|uniref:RidA family protein n=1 Tax=Lampropedia puyangensis TaxID=1330072 RepID=A0A4S8F7L8_9BURK|nr:RidA family protein [Lampropedia puyangensis]THU02841.1 RidA family protein [Lampropedia puyangensis]